MEGQLNISYYWSCDQEVEIPELHKEALREDAETRIFEMIGEGYRSGELSTSVRFGKDRVPQEDEEDGLTYSGSWSCEFGD